MIDDRDTERAYVDEDNYFVLTQAVSEWLDQVLEDNAIAILRSLNRSSLFDIEDFTNELADWPYARDPNVTETAFVMFWAFHGDYRMHSLQNHFRNFLERVARQRLDRWPEPEKALFIEACSLDDEQRPIDRLESEKREAAIRALLEKLEEILSNHDSDVLLEG